MEGRRGEVGTSRCRSRSRRASPGSSAWRWEIIVWDVQGVRVASRVACLREVNWARFEPNFFVVFPEGPLDAAPQSFVMLSRVEDPASRARLQRAVVDVHPNVSTLDLTQVQRAIESILDRVVLAIRFMALFSLAAGAVVLVGAVAASRYQRVREGALLRTLGATRPQLLRILLAEYAVLGALAAVTAIALSTLAGFVLVRFVFEGQFAVPGPAMLALVLSVMVMTVVVGLVRQHRGLAAPAPRGPPRGVTRPAGASHWRGRGRSRHPLAGTLGRALPFQEEAAPSLARIAPTGTRT